MHNSFRRGFEKTASGDYVWHGSPRKLSVLKARNEHGDPDTGAHIFATEHLPMAAAYTGQKWGDRDICQYGVKGRYVLEEMRPGAFQDIYGKKQGYLYKLPAESFKHINHRGVQGEVVSGEAIQPLETHVIKNPLSLLQEQGVILKPYNPESQSHKDAISRMRARSLQMPDKGASYLKWVAETNPELAEKIQTPHL